MELTKYTPHSAYAGLQRALQQEWIFIQQVVPNIDILFNKLEILIDKSIFNNFSAKKFLRNINLRRVLLSSKVELLFLNQ